MIDSLCQGRKEEPAEGGEGDGGEGMDASSVLTAAAAGMRRQRLTFALESTRPGEGGGLVGVGAGGFGGGTHLRVEYRRPEAGPGVKTSVRTNEIQPRHKIFQSPPRQTKKTFGFVVYVQRPPVATVRNFTTCRPKWGWGWGWGWGVMSATRRRRQVKVKSGSSLMSRGRGRATRRSWSSPAPPSSSASSYWRTSLAIRLSSPD